MKASIFSAFLLLSVSPQAFSSEKPSGEVPAFELSEVRKAQILEEEVMKATNRPYKANVSPEIQAVRDQFSRPVTIDGPRFVGKTMPNPDFYLKMEGNKIALGELLTLMSRTINYSPQFVDPSVSDVEFKIGFEKLPLLDVIKEIEQQTGVVINLYPEARLVQVMGYN